VIASAAGLMNPGHPRPPGTIALMPFPGEQVPGHAACQLDQRRRPCVLPHAMSSVCEYRFDLCASTQQSASTFSLCHDAATLLAKEVAVRGGPPAVQVKGSGGCSVSDPESPWVTLLTGMWRARPGIWLHGCVPRMSHAVRFELRTTCPTDGAGLMKPLTGAS
jgi:hypothetical protein